MPLEQLRYLTIRYWGYDAQAHEGEMVVNEDAVVAVLAAFERLYRSRFPIQQVRLIDDFAGNDDASMEANNTSAFNCRLVAGTSHWSQHAYGRAVDLNPLTNPYVDGDRVSPDAGRVYLDRNPAAPGMIVADGLAVQAFRAVGWEWGGSWSSAQDFQHFSATGT